MTESSDVQPKCLRCGRDRLSAVHKGEIALSSGTRYGFAQTDSSHPYFSEGEQGAFTLDLRAEPGCVRWVRYDVRLVRYAADCAERVIDLTGPERPQAEAAIQAARAWADDPTEEHRLRAKHAAKAVSSNLRESFSPAECSSDAAANAAFSAVFHHDADYASAAAIFARLAVENRATEVAWQAERRQYYGLPEVEA